MGIPLHLLKYVEDRELLRELADDEDPEVRALVAGNVNCPEDALRKLAKDESKMVRCLVASNPSTPVDVLEEFFRMYKEGDSEMGSHIACNPSAPEWMLEELSEVGDGMIDFHIAGNRNAPERALRLVYERAKGNIVILDLLKRNEATPEDIRIELMSQSK
ncbi:MAG: HEAT repeat domain-containing protein [Candidatus Korarchaeum sp.]